MGLLDMIWKSLSGDKSKDDVLDTVLSELVPGTDQEVTTAEDKEEGWSGTSYFTDKELQCKCGCKEVNMNPDFLAKLNYARELAGKGWKVNSGYRCAKHNAAVGGAKKSSHTTGFAVDISAPTSQKKFEIVTCALKAGFNRIGIGKNFVHLDADTSAGHPANVIWTY